MLKDLILGTAFIYTVFSIDCVDHSGISISKFEKQTTSKLIEEPAYEKFESIKNTCLSKKIS